MFDLRRDVVFIFQVCLDGLFWHYRVNAKRMYPVIASVILSYCIIVLIENIPVRGVHLHWSHVSIRIIRSQFDIAKHHDAVGLEIN